MKLIYSLIFGIVLAGCAFNSHVVTGTSRPAIQPETVRVFDLIPENAQIVGLVHVHEPSAFGIDRTIKHLKNSAAKMGANGIVFDGKESSGNGMNSEYSAKAIFVP